MEKENTANSGTEGTQAGQERELFFKKFMGCCAGMSGSGEKGEKMKEMCSGMMSNPEMMAKMKDMCGKMKSDPAMMAKMKDCCGSGHK